MSGQTDVDNAYTTLNAKVNTMKSIYENRESNPIFNLESHDYVPHMHEAVYEDIAQLLDRQTTIYFISTIALISAIIGAVMISSNK